MGFIRLDGTVVGTLISANYEQNRFGKDCLKLEGQFEGTNDTVVECPAWFGDQLTDLGVMGQDQGGVWVDSSKRVAITKTGKGAGNVRWSIEAGNGKSTQLNSQPQQQSRPSQQQRPQQQRPSGATSSRPSQQPNQQPQNGQQQRPQQQAARQPSEAPDVTRRRIETTLAHCLRKAAELWVGLGEAGKEVDPRTVQATAATLFVEYRNQNVPLFPDPQAPPPITKEQVAGLKELKTVAIKLGFNDQWFNQQVASKNVHISETGINAATTKDQGQAAIEHLAKILADEEQKQATASQPQQQTAPAGGEIPF